MVPCCSRSQSNGPSSLGMLWLVGSETIITWLAWNQEKLPRSEVTRTHRIGAGVGCVGRGVRRIDGAVVDHGDEGHRHVDPHGVDVGEAKERQEGQDMAFAETRSFVCKGHLISV